LKRILFLVFIISIFCLCVSQAVAESSLSNVYAIGPNDVLEIRVLDHDELRTMATVTSDGSITFPYIGTVNVEGKGVSEIEKIITDKLSEGYIKYPVVTVSLVRSLSKKIFVYGELFKRGEIPIQDDVTVLQALSMAGGVTENGKYGTAKIMRKEEGRKEYETIIETSMNNGIIMDKKVENMLLHSNDMLIVEHNKTFLIQGEALKRGRFSLEKDMTVLHALLLAGGVTNDGRYGMIKIRRNSSSSSTGYKDIAEAHLIDGDIEDKEVENIYLEPDDIVIIERNKTFLIQGGVAQRGRFPLEKDMRVINALLQVGGVVDSGLFGRIIVRRQEKVEGGGYRDIAISDLSDGMIVDKAVEDLTLQPDDIIIVERSRSITIQGEIAVPGRYVLEDGMTVLGALAVSKGVRGDGYYGKLKIRRKHEEGLEYKTLELDVQQILRDDTSGELLLEPDDTLIVERNDTYFIYGEVQKPGEFVLKSDMTAFKALTIAGGFTKWGSGSKVKILRTKRDKSGFETIKVKIDDVIDGDADADIFLEPGDTIIVSAGVF